MPLIKVNLHDNVSERSNLAGYNNIGSSGTTGTRVADLLDTNGDPTGVAFVQSVSLSATGNLSHAVSVPNSDFVLGFYHAHWYPSLNATGELCKLTGLPAGASYTIKLAGNHGGSTITNYTVTNGAPSPASYDNAGQNDPVPAPVEITGTVPENGEVSITFGASGYARANGFSIEYTVETGPSITTADNITSEGDTVTFTLANTTEAPVSATLDTAALNNLTFVSEDTQAGTKTYSYTAPLIADNPTATLEISVDSTTVSAQISYENSLPLGLITHAEPDTNSIMFGNTFATTDEIEMATPQLISGDAGAATIDWSALDADQGWTKDIANYATGNSDGIQVWQFQWLNTSDNTTGTFTRTITIGNGGGSVTVGIPVGIRDLYPDVAAVSLVNNDSGRVTMDSRGVLNTTALYSECVVDMDGTQHRVFVKGGGRGVKPFYKVNWQILD